MEQSPEAAPTPSSGDVEAEETIVLKKPAAVAETNESADKKEESEEKQEEQKQEDVEVVATIKVEKKTTVTPAETEVETEEIIVEEVEESEPSISESEKEETEVIKKPAVESAEKKETVAVVQETATVKINVPVEEKEAEPSEEEVEEEIEEEVEEEEEEEEKEEAVVESKEVPKAESEKKDEIDSSPAKVETSVQVVSAQQSKQENVNNTIKEIISDIDTNIREQERIAILKQEELKLLQKQQELAQQIREQQILAQKLVSQNDRLQQQYQQQQQQQQYPKQETQQPQPNLKFESTQQICPPQTTSRYSTFEETKDGNVITQKTSSYETEESSNVTKRIDLQKIFTPATDADEILPRNRKLYASSAFYTPGLHPTVEDQVELARRISHSLSDMSNQQSKGQSMYVNRKKRSVKWVHEGQDYHPHQGQVPPKPPTSPSILPAYSDAGKHRVQLNLHQEQVLEKYARPGLQVVRSPWEAALETGSASAAFVDGGKAQHSITPTPSPAPIYDNVNNLSAYSAAPAPEIQQNNLPPKYNKPSSFNDHQKDLAYKPNLAQGWKAPSVSLPKELYMPKEIPLESYAPPPVVNLKPTTTYSPLYQSQEQPHTWTPAISPAPATISPSPYNDYSFSKPTPVDQNTSAFPIVNKPAPKPQYGGGGSSFPISAKVPPKQQYWEPTSYQKVQQPSLGHKVPQVNFNPSPLSYDKLAKFENADDSGDVYPQQRYLAPSHHGQGSKIRNTSPAPFAAKSPVSLPYSPPMQQYSNYGSTSYSPSIPSSTPTYGHHNPNELLHGPTFNSSARGWKSSGGVNTLYSKPRAPLTTGGHMPYTDF